MSIDKDILKRFESKYITDPNSGCWLWIACRDNAGYGHLQINNKAILAHRVSYELFRGEIPTMYHVLHRCDVPSCVNPDHLFLGTHKTNMEDKVLKGRSSALKGELNPTSKLTWDKVDEIRNKYIPYKYSLYKLASEYNVAVSAIHNIITGKTWSKESINDIR